MSQPIKLYRKDGSVLYMYSPNVVKELVQAGELFRKPPAIPPKPKTRKRKTGAK